MSRADDYREFWTHFVDFGRQHFPDIIEDLAPKDDSWLEKGIELPDGVNIRWKFYVRDKKFTVGIYPTNRDAITNTRVIEGYLESKELMEKETGVTLELRGKGKDIRPTLFAVFPDGIPAMANRKSDDLGIANVLNDPDLWDDLIEWGFEIAQRLIPVFISHFN